MTVARTMPKNPFVPYITTSYLIWFSIISAVYYLFTKSWTYWSFILPLLYGCWYIYDRKHSTSGGRRSHWFRRTKLLQKIRDYFPISLIKTAELDPKHNYILGYHPHGTNCFGAVINFSTDVTDFSGTFPGLTSYLVSHSTGHHWWGMRELFALLGMVEASEPSIDYILKKSTGNVVVIVVGGGREIYINDEWKNYLVIKNRKGFIRKALQHGAHLVPCYSFGENRTMRVRYGIKSYSDMTTFQRIVKEWTGGFVPCIPYGRYGSMMPFKVPISTVVGRPIPVTKCESPTQEQIDELHGQYVRALEGLFEEYKGQYNIGEDCLTLVE